MAVGTRPFGRSDVPSSPVRGRFSPHVIGACGTAMAQSGRAPPLETVSLPRVHMYGHGALWSTSSLARMRRLVSSAASLPQVTDPGPFQLWRQGSGLLLRRALPRLDAFRCWLADGQQVSGFKHTTYYDT